MNSVATVGTRSLMQHRGRTALTAFGVALGVAILTGVLVVNASIERGIDDFNTSFAGNTDVVVSAAAGVDAVLPDDMAPAVRSLADVEVVSPAVGFGVNLAGPDTDEDEGWRWLGGYQLDRVREIYPLELSGGRFWTPGALEVVLPDRLAEELELALGDTVDLRTPTGVHTVLVVGTLRNAAALPAQGRSPFTSIETTRALYGKPDIVDVFHVVLADGVDATDWVEEHEAALPPGAQAKVAGSGGEQFRNFLAVVSSAFTLVAAIALFVSGFLIYLTFSMAIIERVRLYGTLRALGARPRQVRGVVLREALALGLVASPLGLVLGIGLSHMLLGFVSNLMRAGRPPLTVTLATIATALALGVGVPVVATLAPARRAARLQPVVAMRGGLGEPARPTRTWVVGALLLVVGLAVSANASDTLRRGVTTLSLLLGSVLVVPVLLRPVAAVVGRLTRRLAPGVGDVAVMHLVKERSRSAYTLALVMVVLAMLFAIGAANTSMSAAMEDVLERQFGADLAMDAAGGFDAAIQEEAEAVDGVEATSTLRFGGTKIIGPDGEEQDSFLMVIDAASYFEVSSLALFDGDQESVRDALVSGGSAVISEPTARRRGVAIGDAITLATAGGPQDFQVVATTSAFGTGQPVIVGLPDGRAHFAADRGHSLLVDLSAGATVDEVAERIEERFAARADFHANPITEVRSDARAQLRGFFALFYGLLLTAAFVGLLGLANTMAVSVLQRFREIGVLRAIGTLRAQVRRMVLVESATLVLVALALAVPLGVLLSLVLVRGTSDALYFTVDYRFPLALPPILGAVALVLAVAAAVVPARRAGKLEVVSALQYE